MIRIELKSMKFYAFHGVAQQERKVGNQFIVDLCLTVDVAQALDSDDLCDTINYAEVYKIVKQEMMQPSNLLETVAGRIVKALQFHFQQIQHISVKVAKLNPPFGGDVYSAAVIIDE